MAFCIKFIADVVQFCALLGIQAGLTSFALVQEQKSLLWRKHTNQRQDVFGDLGYNDVRSKN